MSKIYNKTPHCRGIEDHQKYLSRITKSFYYGKLPKNDMLSLPVTELAVEIFSESQKGKSLDRLHCNTAAQISRNACVSPCSFVMALLYFERLKKHNTEYIERTTPSDLFLVCLMVSSKFLFDDGETDEVFMDEWAASAGMTCKELAQLEKNFLKAIDWKIYVSELSFWKKLGEIETTLAKKQGLSRGYFTYTELQALASHIDIKNIMHCVMAVSVILAATYTAGLLTIIGSVFLASQIPGTSLYQKRLDSSYLIKIDNSSEKIEADSESPENLTKIEAPAKCHNLWNLNAINVLKTSILLASIKTASTTNQSKQVLEINTDNNNYYFDMKEDSFQYITWDWWNIPVMNWLSKTSEFIQDFWEIPVVQNYMFYLGNIATNEKYISLKDHIHKATKTRIQDQLESSWHEEWIDNNEFYFNILSYLQHPKKLF